MRELLAVVGGALVGTLVRFGLDVGLPHSDVALPVSTLVINALGSFALGYLVARVWPWAPPWVRAALGPGLLGSFTTFSAFAVSLVTLSAVGEFGLAAIYLAATVVAGGIAALAGLRLGARPASAGGPAGDSAAGGTRS